MALPGWLPPLFEMSSCGGWDDLLSITHKQFLKDFIHSVAQFRGKKVRLRLLPMSKDKEAVFWHLVQEGSDEDERTPDIARLERIAWVRALIDASAARGRVCVWNNVRQTGRGPKNHWVIALQDFSYVVVLRDDGSTVLLLTAYPIEGQRKREKLQKEFEKWQRENPGL